MPEDLPYMQFFPSDWLADCDVLSMSARGAWQTFLCKAWLARRASISLNPDQWARIFGASTIKAKQAIKEIEDWNIGDIIREDDGRITIVSRRIERDLKTRGATQKKRSNAARIAAEKRWAKHNDAKGMQKACDSHAKGNADAMRNDAIPESIVQNPESKPPNPPGGTHVKIPKLLGRIIRCITPSSKLDTPRDKAEVRAWENAKSMITSEDVEIVERFYRLKKSPNQDFTWNRKSGVAALLNQWTSQVEYAKSMKAKPSNSPAWPPMPKKLELPEPDDWKNRVPEHIAERGWEYLCTNDQDLARRLSEGEVLAISEPIDFQTAIKEL